MDVVFEKGLTLLTESVRNIDNGSSCIGYLNTSVYTTSVNRKPTPRYYSNETLLLKHLRRQAALLALRKENDHPPQLFDQHLCLLVESLPQLA